MKESEFVSLGHGRPDKTHDATQGRSNEVIVAAAARSSRRENCYGGVLLVISIAVHVELTYFQRTRQRPIVTPRPGLHLAHDLVRPS
jgi:hypothetical protein